MAITIKIPNDLWEGDDIQAVITQWLVADGAHVNAGDLVAELMTEKVQHELRAPAAGVIRLGKALESVVNKGDTVATLE